MWICSKCGAKVDADFEICWACGASADGVEDPTVSPETEGIIPVDKLPPAEPEPAYVDWVPLTWSTMSTEAATIKARLEEEGIPVFLADSESFSTAFPFSTGGFGGGVKVNVPKDELKRAQQVLAKYSPDYEPPADSGLYSAE